MSCYLAGQGVRTELGSRMSGLCDISELAGLGVDAKLASCGIFGDRDEVQRL